MLTELNVYWKKPEAIKAMGFRTRKLALLGKSVENSAIFYRPRGVGVRKLHTASSIGRDVTHKSTLTSYDLSQEREATAKRISEDVQEIRPEIMKMIKEFINDKLRKYSSQGRVKIPPAKATFVGGKATTATLIAPLIDKHFHMEVATRERKEEVKGLIRENESQKASLMKQAGRVLDRISQRAEDLPAPSCSTVVKRWIEKVTGPGKGPSKADLLREKKAKRKRQRTQMYVEKRFDEVGHFQTAIKEIDRENERLAEEIRDKTGARFSIEESFGRLIDEEYSMSQQTGPKVPKARLTVITTHCAKTRGITIHEPLNSWACVNMTTLTNGFLRRQVESQPSLAGDKIIIEREDNGEEFFAYSVDYSKATDPISVTTAREILFTVGAKCGFPEWYNKSVDMFFRPHEISYQKEGRDGKTTVETLESRCGCLMGQGPGWTVLSILNMFCGSLAAGRDTFRIMGDDLIGLFTKSEISTFERVVELVKLVLNRKKSFQSKEYGVFCEKLLKISRRHGKVFLEEVPTDRIGEFTATKLDGTTGLGVLDRLQGLRAYTKTGRERKKRVLARTTKGLPKGSLTTGGSGFGKTSRSAFVNFLRRGPTQTNVRLKLPGFKEIKEHLPEGREKGPKTVPKKDLMVRLRSFCHSSHLLEAGAKRPRNSFGLKEFKRQFRKGANPMRTLKEVVTDGTCLHLNLSKKAVRDAKFFIARGAFRHAAKALRREQYYDEGTFEKMMDCADFKLKRLLRVSKTTVPKAAVEVSFK
jgi:hypothetical protein